MVIVSRYIKFLVLLFSLVLFSCNLKFNESEEERNTLTLKNLSQNTKIEGKKITILEGIQVISNSLFEDKDIVEVVLPSTILKIETGAFARSNVRKINFPSSLEYIGIRAFNQTQLTEITLPSNSKLTHLKELVFAGNKLTSITIPKQITVVEEGALIDNPLTEVIMDNELYQKSKNYIFNFISMKGSYTIKSLEGTILSKGIMLTSDNKDDYITSTVVDGEADNTDITIKDEVTDIASYAFKDSSLKKVVLSNNLRIIGTGAFSNNELTEVIFPPSVESVYEAAFADNNINSVIINNINMHFIGQVFPKNGAENRYLTVLIPTDADLETYKKEHIRHFPVNANIRNQ